jgi:uncharacterized protein YndB with AHSA1/START domain
MPVTGITTDVDTRTLTITAEFAAPVTRVWAMYADPRQLEQVWGPPQYPATFVDHDLRPDGTRTTYYMTTASPRGREVRGLLGHHASAHDMQKVLDMGMEEGARQATNQIDDFLARHPAA